MKIFKISFPSFLRVCLTLVWGSPWFNLSFEPLLTPTWLVSNFDHRAEKNQLLEQDDGSQWERSINEYLQKAVLLREHLGPEISSRRNEDKSTPLSWIEFAINRPPARSIASCFIIIVFLWFLKYFNHFKISEKMKNFAHCFRTFFAFRKCAACWKVGFGGFGNFIFRR